MTDPRWYRTAARNIYDTTPPRRHTNEPMSGWIVAFICIVLLLGIALG